MLTLKTRKRGAGSTFRERLSEIKVAYQVSKQMKSERWFVWGWARETATDKLRGASHEHVAVIRCERLTIFRRPGLHWIWGTAISFIFISLVMHRFLQGWVWKAKYSRTTADFLTVPSELPHPTPPPADNSTQAVVQPAMLLHLFAKQNKNLPSIFNRSNLSDWPYCHVLADVKDLTAK